MDEKSLRSLIEHGGVKQLRIIAVGALFHVDVVTMKKGQITAMTSKGRRMHQEKCSRVSIMTRSPGCITTTSGITIPNQEGTLHIQFARDRGNGNR